MGTIVAVAGASGYAGGELLRILASHPGVEIGPLAAAGSAGRRLGNVHPHLPRLADRVLIATDAESLAEADLVFLALPHGQSATLAALLPSRVAVVDLGADHRLTSAELWATYYGSAHPHAGTWTYGLPELISSEGTTMRQAIAASTRVANPGCYATAVALALAPLLADGLVLSDDVVAVAASGTSGAGRSPSVPLLGSEVMGAMSAYKVGGVHQHTPEMEQSLSAAAGERGGPVRVSFTPTLAPMPRGILATVTARLARDADVEDLRRVLTLAYGQEPFVHLLAQGFWPNTQSVYGSNSVHIQVAADAHCGRVIVVVALDNLGKGAAGQAVQNANLMLGMGETTGLAIDGVAP